MIRHLIALSVVFLVGCCTHGSSVKRLQVFQAINDGHAKDEKLPPAARLIAKDNAAAISVVVAELGGPKVSKEHRDHLEKARSK